RIFKQKEIDQENANKRIAELEQISAENSKIATGQKEQIKAYERFIDDLWIKLNPVGKTKSTQAIIAEITEILTKEEQDEKNNEDLTSLRTTHSWFIDEVKKVAGIDEVEVSRIIEKLKEK